MPPQSDSPTLTRSSLQVRPTGGRPAEAHVSEERFRAMIEQAPFSVQVFSPAGDCLYANRAWEELWGARREQLVGYNLLADSQLAAKGVLPHLQRAFAGESVFIPPVYYDPAEIGQPGQPRWTEAIIYPVKDEAGQTLMVTLTHKDVTAQHQAAEIVLKSEQHFKALIQNSADVIQLLNQEGAITYVSPSVTRVLGYTPEELAGRPAPELLHPDEFEQLQQSFNSLLQRPGGAESVKQRVRCKDGSWRWIDVTASNLLADPAVQAIVINYHDITDHKRAEDALRESEARFRALIENSSDAIALINADGVIQYASPATTRLLGYTPEEFVGLNGLTLIHPDDLKAATETLRTAYQQPGPATRAEYRVRRKDGVWRWINGTIQNLMADPNVGAIIVNYRDVTERREADAALRASAAEIAALYRASASLVRPDGDMTALAEQVAQAVTEEFALADCGVMLMSESGDELKRIARAGSYRVEASVPLLLTGQGLTANAARTGQVVYAPDVTASPDYLASVAQTRSELVIPLKVGERVIGVLDLQSPEPNAFDERARRVVTAYAERAALALENARLLEQARHRSAELEALNRQAEQHLQRLAALRQIDMGITGSLDLRITLNLLLEQVTAQLNVDAASVLTFNPHLYMLEYAAGRGFHSPIIVQTRLRMGEGYAGRAALERRPVRLPNLAEEEVDFTREALTKREAFQAYYGVPLISKGLVVGVLEVFHRSTLLGDLEWLDFLEALAEQAAIAIDNARLFTQLQQTNSQLAVAYDATIEGWSRALDLRDKETEGHSQRVTDMTLALARALGAFGEADLVHIRRGALLHDIGKMGIPDHILLKPGPLTDEEWEIMRRHPTYAYELLSPIAHLRPALDIPYCHHEKWDGSGYPRGLKGEQIPLAARIFAVVDVWDALRSDRPYRAGWPMDQARAHIRSLAGTHFDAEVADVFLNLGMSQSSSAGGIIPVEETL